MNNKPLVSIFLPAYNQEDFVEEALLSAIEQDYPNLEVVVGDDGSTDGTVDIIMEYAQKYPDRVKLVEDKTHLGITGNCNRLLKHCQGKYIAFFAGDDILLPGKITKQVEWLEEDEKRVLCYHEVEAFETNTTKTWKLSAITVLGHGKGSHNLVRKARTFPATSVMVRSTVFPTYGFDERLPIVSDWKLWVDCLASGGEYGYIEGIYTRYRVHNRSVTQIGGLKYKTDQFVALALVEAEHPHLLADGRYLRASQFAKWGSKYLLAGDNKLGKIYLQQSLLLNPCQSWKFYVYFLATFFPTLSLLLQKRVRAKRNEQKKDI